MFVDYAGSFIFEPHDLTALIRCDVVDLPHSFLVDITKLLTRSHLEYQNGRRHHPSRRVAPHQCASEHRADDQLTIIRKADLEQLAMPFYRFDALASKLTSCMFRSTSSFRSLAVTISSPTRRVSRNSRITTRSGASGIVYWNHQISTAGRMRLAYSRKSRSFFERVG